MRFGSLSLDAITNICTPDLSVTRNCYKSARTLASLDDSPLTGRIIEPASVHVWDGSPRVTPVLRNETWNVNHERQWRTWRQAGTGASTTTACARAAPWAPLTRQAETPGPPAARLAGGRGRKEHNHSEPRQAQAFKSPKASVSACVHRFPACVHRGKNARRGSELSRTFTHGQSSWGSAPPDGPHSRAGRHATETVGERPRSRDCPAGQSKLSPRCSLRHSYRCGTITRHPHERNPGRQPIST